MGLRERAAAALASQEKRNASATTRHLAQMRRVLAELLDCEVDEIPEQPVEFVDNDRCVFEVDGIRIDVVKKWQGTDKGAMFWVQNGDRSTPVFSLADIGRVLAE